MPSDFSSYTKALQWSLQADLKASDALAGNFSCVEDTQGLGQWMQEQSVQVFLQGEVDYPFALQAGWSTTKLVYGIGDRSCLDMPRMSIVWPRQPSIYAGQVLDALFADIQWRKMCIVSGGAPWIDQRAHRLAIEHGLPTIVVLWCGLRVARQSALRELLQRVVASWGLVLSAWKLMQTPTNFTFPQRNKLIAGLGEILFVPAAGKKSGSLITVDFAYKMGKHVYTVPGSIFEPESAGTNELLVEKRAQAVVTWTHMLDTHFPSLRLLSPADRAVSTVLSDDAQRLMHCFGQTATSEYLLEKTGFSIGYLLELLTDLEIQKYIVPSWVDERTKT
jgi:DNA processing protein